MNEAVIIELAKSYDSFYLYDERTIDKQISYLRNHFESIKFLYSVKSNPNPAVVKSILSRGLGIDAASTAEVLIGVKNGLCKEEIYYSAPGKTERDIIKTIGCSVLIADSLSEIELINDTAKQMNRLIEIGVRINPDFSFNGNTGQPSKFGIDKHLFFESIPQIERYANIRITGIHVHIGSQQLDTETMVNYYRNVFRLAASIQQVLGRKLKFINMGSGIGIRYANTDNSLDIERLGTSLKTIQYEFRAILGHIKVLIETGRYVIGEAGIYVTKVLDKKKSYGNTFIILKNTMNGFLRPSLAQLIAKYAGTTDTVSGEPLFTHCHASDFWVPGKQAPTEKVTLVGNLCTATDLVAENIELPQLEHGDVIVMSNAGSYGATLSPIQFSLQEHPSELFLTREGDIINSYLTRPDSTGHR